MRNRSKVGGFCSQPFLALIQPAYTPLVVSGGSSHAGCPNCQCEVNVDDPGGDADVVCAACGNTFRLEMQETIAHVREAKSIGRRFVLEEKIGQGAFRPCYANASNPVLK